MNRTAIEAAQLAKLNSLLGALSSTNPFYAKKLSGLKQVSSLAEFFAHVPVTTKSELVADQIAHPPFGSNLTFLLDSYARFTQTSATTGQPLRWLDTLESWNWMVDCWLQVYRAAGVRRGERIYFAFSFGPFLGFWLAFDAGEKLGCLCIPGGGLNSAARLRAIIDNGVTVLCCTPTYALRLAEVAKTEHIDLSQGHVKTIIVAGEPGGSIPATRAKIAETWNGARVFDHHGMTEVGPVTYEWRDRPGYLAVIESEYIAEVIDPVSGREVEVGQTGELVITNLGRIGSPLLRYRTGDRVKKALIQDRLAFEGGILGRVDDVVIVRGVNLHPSAVEEVIRSFVEVTEYRVEIRQQQSMTELAVVVEPMVSCGNAIQLSAKLEVALQTAFMLRIPVVTVAPGTLPRFEMKAKRWITVPER